MLENVKWPRAGTWIQPPTGIPARIKQVHFVPRTRVESTQLQNNTKLLPHGFQLSQIQIHEQG